MNFRSTDKSWTGFPIVQTYKWTTCERQKGECWRQRTDDNHNEESHLYPIIHTNNSFNGCTILQHPNTHLQVWGFVPQASSYAYQTLLTKPNPKGYLATFFKRKKLWSFVQWNQYKFTFIVICLRIVMIKKKSKHKFPH